MVLNATFNNISVISWQSALLVEEARVPVIMLYRVHPAMSRIRTHNLVIGTDCRGSCKSNDCRITTTTVLNNNILKSNVNKKQLEQFFNKINLVFKFRKIQK